MFNNFYEPFVTTEDTNRTNSSPAASVGGFKVYRVAGEQNLPLEASIGMHKGGREGPINFLNLTSSLAQANCNSPECIDWLAYVFAPATQVKALHLTLNSTLSDAVGKLHLETEYSGSSATRTYDVTMALQHLDFSQRSMLLGSTGRVLVATNNQEYTAQLGSPNATRQCQDDLKSGLESTGGVRCVPPINSQLVIQQAYEKQVVGDRFSPIYSQKGKVPFLYCGIPKCGCSRWRRLIRLVEGVQDYQDRNTHNPNKNGLRYLWQLPLNEMDGVVNDPSVKSFVLVRNPYTRALSGWLDKTPLARHDKVAPPLLFDGKNVLPDDFPTFVRMLVQTPLHKLNEHWLPMVTFCGIANGMQFDHVVKMEELSDWGEKLAEEIGVTEEIREGWGDTFFPRRQELNVTSHNRNSHDKVKLYYTQELVELIKVFYMADFEVFGYAAEKSPLDW
jgi:hypothetical protein